MIDYNEICENLREEDVFRLLEQLGAQPIDKGDYILCRTICHHDDDEGGNYKLYYYKNTHLFYCYSECGAMSIFKFLKHYYETRGIEYDWYKDVLQVILSCSVQRQGGAQSYKSRRGEYEEQKVRKELPSFPDGLLDCFVKIYPQEWLKDGISKEAMDKYNIRFSISQNKIIIPHYDVNDRLVGIRGRALDTWEIENLGKYMPVQIENKWYSHPLSLNLYGLNKNKENIRKYGVCYIAEGEKSTLQAESFSFPNCTCATCGSTINKYQLDLLLRFCQPREIIICFDKEELPGQNVYFNKLYALCEKYKRYAKMSFVYDKKNLLNAKESPFDKGEEVFKHLIETRVKV